MAGNKYIRSTRPLPPPPNPEIERARLIEAVAEVTARNSRVGADGASLLFNDSYGRCRRCRRMFGPDLLRSWVNDQFCHPCVEELDYDVIRRRIDRALSEDVAPTGDLALDALTDGIPIRDPDAPKPVRRRRRASVSGADDA